MVESQIGNIPGKLPDTLVATTPATDTTSTPRSLQNDKTGGNAPARNTSETRIINTSYNTIGYLSLRKYYSIPG